MPNTLARRPWCIHALCISQMWTEFSVAVIFQFCFPFCLFRMGFHGYCSFTEAWEMLECGSVRLIAACWNVQNMLFFFPFPSCTAKQIMDSAQRPAFPSGLHIVYGQSGVIQAWDVHFWAFGGLRGRVVVYKFEPTRLVATSAPLSAVAVISQNARNASSLIPAGAMPWPEVTRVLPEKCCPIPVSAPYPL